MKFLQHRYYSPEQDCYCAVGLLAHHAGVSNQELQDMGTTRICSEDRQTTRVLEIICKAYNVDAPWVDNVQVTNDIKDEKSLQRLFKEKNLGHMLDEEITFTI